MILRLYLVHSFSVKQRVLFASHAYYSAFEFPCMHGGLISLDPDAWNCFPGLNVQSRRIACSHGLSIPAIYTLVFTTRDFDQNPQTEDKV